ncbi:alkaline phosphatase family protein [Acidipila sp. EB88]|uniref:alkaline phosphatase family protein n=1 Tax=Acidipila sp. EB88 TaxID=2305226 RepID=UPI001315A8F8|nr:alkaline phosphatase family protein [Acidipila sp. EB88]
MYGISLKDRAAILPAGAAANGAFWIDSASGRFVTSTYYMQQLPEWAAAFDDGPDIQLAAGAANVTSLTNFYSQVGATNAANTYEVSFAEALIAGEQLGTHPATDMLTLSLSPNDIEGHHFGPDSPEEHSMVLGLDATLDLFFSWLDTHVPGGLANVVIALSADHGIAPTPAVSSALGLPGAYINTDRLVADLNQAMNAKFSPGENVVYVLPHQELPYLSLNRPTFERAGINEQEAEDAVQVALEPAFRTLAPPTGEPRTVQTPNPAPGGPAPAIAAPVVAASTAKAPPAEKTGRTGAAPAAPYAGTMRTATSAAPLIATGPAGVPAKTALNMTPPDPAPPRVAPSPQLFRSFTRLQMAAGQVPPTEFGQLLAHSYSPNGGWYVAAFPVAFQMEGSGSGGTTHFSPFSYDRHVPLGFFGAPFVPGTYLGRVEPVDIASTLASVLGVNQPSAAVGHVLTQALKPAAEFAYPKEPAAAPHHARRGRRAGAAVAVPESSPEAPPAGGAK